MTGLVLLAVATSASADDVDRNRAPIDDWSLSIAPYAWAAGMKGTVAGLPGLRPVGVDASFQDLLENLDIGIMVSTELRYHRWAAFSDILYINLSADADTPAGILFDHVDVDQETFIGTFAGAYRAFDDGGTFIDVMAGVRVWSVDTRLALDGGLLADQEREHNENWLDPMIGAKARYQFENGIFLNGVVQIGGFGAASDFFWDVFSGVGYQFNDSISAVGGYRHLEEDYEHNGFVFDVEMSGPVLGAVIRF